MATNEWFESENPKTTCAVIGGRSFIGKSLVSMLLNKTDKWVVRILDSGPLNLDLIEKNFLSEAISYGRASYFQLPDLRDTTQINRAIEGSHVVFHLGMTVTAANDFYLQYIAIVQGTKNVIHACRDCKVKHLIYNSSADVVFDGIHDIHNGDDSLPYPSTFDNMLSDLKAQAEAIVLCANRDGLSTCVLRPSNAFGPGDLKLVPLLLSLAKSGLAKFIVGDGENMCDFTYVDNIAHAHICAEEALRSKAALVAGKAFFITNLEPVKFWDFVSLILEGLGYPRPRIKVPAKLVWIMAILSNWVHEKLEQSNANSTLTYLHRFSCTTTFNCFKALSRIGYKPIVTLEEGVTLTIESFYNGAEDSLLMRYQFNNEPSKADRLLGSGIVADVLLWRDEKTTFSCFLGLTLLYYWFIFSGRTFVSSVADLLLMLLVILFSYRFLPTSLFGFVIKKMSSSHFEVSKIVKDIIKSLGSAWNSGMQTMRLIGHEGDWNIFLKVMSCLYVFKLLASLPLAAAIGIVLVFAFTAFFVYMQYEDEVDRTFEFCFIGVKSLKGFLVRNLRGTVASRLRS